MTGHSVEHAAGCSDTTVPAIDCYDWDKQAEAGSRPKIDRPFGPSKNGSRYCRSGSIASGGAREYCTCDSCF